MVKAQSFGDCTTLVSTATLLSVNSKMRKQPSLFDLEAGETRKEQGLALAESNSDLVQIAREIAKSVAKTRNDRCITIDAVYHVMHERGYDIDKLGNAAGSVFRESCWNFTGNWKKSERSTNHARVVRIWRLVE